jgi:N-acetylglutamate synthase-like GNAT family acetyltransferase
MNFKKTNTFNICAASQKEIEFIDNKIVEFNNHKVPFTQKRSPILKNYIIKNKEKIIAGINAVIYNWKILYIDVLFVDEAFREKQLGSSLLQKVENEAKAMGAILAHLDTFDFQAKDFYIKHGYEVFGVLTNCPPNHKRYYLKKTLKESRE